MAPFLAPKLAQNRLKIASRRFLRPLFFKNADFHADLRFPRFFHQNRPQDEAKIGLRSPQDGSKTVLKSFFSAVKICLRFCSVLYSILVAFGSPFGSQNGTKIDHKIVQNRSRGSRAKKYPSRPSWDRLGAVLGRSWAILTGLGAIVGRLAEPKTLIFLMFFVRRFFE